MSKLHVTVLSLVIAALSFTGGMFFRDFHLKLRAAQGAEERGRFKATTKFIIQEVHMPEIPEGASSRVLKSPWLQTYIKIISSREVLLRVVKRLNLDQEWQTPPNQAAERVARQIDVELEAGTEIVSVIAWGNNLLEVANIANGVREAYEEFLTEREAERFRRLTQNVEAQITKQIEEVDKARLEMKDFQRKYDLLDTTDIFAAAASGSVSIAGREQAALTSEDKEHLREYQTAKHRYHAALQLLSIMRELAARQKVDQGVVKKPIEVLEVATPPMP